MRSRICRVLHTCCLQHHSKSLPEVSFAICFRLQVLRPPDVDCSGLPEWEEFRLAAVEHSRLSASLALSLGLLVVLSSLRNGWPDVNERAELDQLEAGNLLGRKGNDCLPAVVCRQCHETSWRSGDGWFAKRRNARQPKF